LYYTRSLVAPRQELLNLDLLDDDDPFEIDDQAAHLFKHASLGIEHIYEAWESGPLFYPAIPPADWLMVADLGGQVVVVPLAKANSGDPARCRPIGCYEAAQSLTEQYRADRQRRGER
jgi:hypothetical protein